MATYQTPWPPAATKYEETASSGLGYSGNSGFAQPYNAAPAVQAVAMPQSEFDAHTISEGKFEPVSGWRDPIWAIIFLLNTAVVIALFFVGVSKVPSFTPIAVNASSGANALQFVGISAFSMFAGLGLAMGYLVLVKSFATQLIWGTLIGGVFFNLALAIMFFVLRSIFGGIVFLLMTVLAALMVYFWRSRIPFAALLLTTISEVLGAYRATTLVAFLAAMVQFVFMVLWVFGVALASTMNQNSAIPLLIFQVFAFYWTVQVIMNVVHVTTAGVVASWYFQQVPVNPTLGAAKRALTTSFGSICLGSLLVAAIKTVRFIVRSIRNKNSQNPAVAILACMADCMLGVIERMVQWFNRYAYTQVAIYGKTYCEAAKATMALIQSRGIDALINDSLVGPVLTLGAIVGGIITGAIAALWGFYAVPAYWGACAAAGFFIGLVMVSVVMETVDSGVTCLFVCYAEEPQLLSQLKPDLAAAFVRTDTQRYV
eukprot:TRINITY_DN14502_c0_g1_i1.p1 TRINITY_DN14502_c0_g1~~TRINITY_DN14502_c0_g1_i1.p1  ORF type:complete len:485 (-),score=75.69 TRINITY_DN14502_c0_g1_i1:62-1516(-)